MILQLNQLIHQLRQEKITLLFVKAGGEKKSQPGDRKFFLQILKHYWHVLTQVKLLK